MKIQLGEQMSGKVNLGFFEDDDNATYMGFDVLTDDEIINMMQRSRNPELMGGRLKKWLARRKKRAKAFAAKLKKKFNKLPKWAKIATGVVLGPVALATAPLVAATAATTAAVALPAAALALPAASKVGIGLLVRKAAKKHKQRQAALLRQRAVQNAQIQASVAQQAKMAARMKARTMKVRQLPKFQPGQAGPYVQPQQQYLQPVAAAPVAVATEKKGAGMLGTVAALGALALPFILKR